MKNFCGVILFFLAALVAVAQSGTGVTTTSRTMSLQDCIQQALTHNLDVQIERFNPQISLYNLNAAYSGYDPVFNAGGAHTYNDQGALVNSAGQFQLPTVTRENNFNSGLSGGTPWGMTYDLTGNVSQSDTSKNLLTNSISGDSSSGQILATLKQPLLKNFWIDATRLNVRLAKNRLKFSEQGLREQLIASVTSVQNAYYELIFAATNVMVQQEALNLAQTQLDQDQQRVQIGTLAQLDVQQDQSQVAQSKANLIAAQYALETAQNVLKNLLSDTNYAKWHDLDIRPAEQLTAPLQLFDLQDSWNRGMSGRPDLLQARLNVEEQGIQLKFYYNQLYPELDLVGTYGYNGQGRYYSDSFGQISDGSRPTYSYGAQLSMPLGNLGPRNTYKASKATLQQVVLQLKQFEQNVMVEIDNAVKQAQSAYESVDATRLARVYAEAALDAEQKKYAVGKSTTFTVLQLQTALTTARSQEIRSLANYNEALANLAAQEGSTLERNNINVETK
jgi:outer membrane protein TolC